MPFQRHKICKHPITSTSRTISRYSQTHNSSTSIWVKTQTYSRHLMGTMAAIRQRASRRNLSTLDKVSTVLSRYPQHAFFNPTCDIAVTCDSFVIVALNFTFEFGVHCRLDRAIFRNSAVSTPHCTCSVVSQHHA